MIFDRDLVTAMTSVIVMTKLPLQALISSVGGQFVAIISKERGVPGHSQR